MMRSKIVIVFSAGCVVSGPTGGALVSLTAIFRSASFARILSRSMRDAVLHDPQPRMSDDLAIEIALARRPHVAFDEIDKRAVHRTPERFIERHQARVGRADGRIALGLIRDDVLGKRRRCSSCQQHESQDTSSHAR